MTQQKTLIYSRFLLRVPKYKSDNHKVRTPMALFLKPLSDDVIESMGLTTDDLWLVKIEEEVFGPFETASLHDYALENSHEFLHAEASLEELQEWKPFFSHSNFQMKQEAVQEVHEERFWVLNQGQKTGPFTHMAVDKKLEMGLLSLNDMVSVDDGHTWTKFFHMEAFNPDGAAGGVHTLPEAPLASSFARAKEELHERMDSHDRTGSHAALASLVYLRQKGDKPTLKLDEIDLKSLGETEVSRSLKWAIPSAFAGVGVLVALGNFIMTPSTSNEVADVSSPPEIIMPKIKTTATVPTNRANRNPASYMPQPMQRSGLTNTPAVQYNDYRAADHMVRHEDPDPMIEPAHEADIPQPQEHSLVQNQFPQGGESLDGVMSGGQDLEQVPEAPVIEEASDF